MSDNRRLAKNTLYLYVRMLLVMAVSIYTSRIVLAALGVVDYGIYNVVGSVVALFAFLQTTMANASHRFIAYALGKNEHGYLKKIFSTSVELHLMVAIVIVLLCETIGLWFFYNKLNIPIERRAAAFIVLQLSILSSFISVCLVPYNAEIIAHERMKFYAYLSIADVFVKLFVALVITIVSADKLIWYAVLLFMVQIAMYLVYSIYCRNSFKECRFQFVADKALFKEIGTFTGWNILGHMATTMSSQGLNMLLNIYFGPALNAAKGIAQQVEHSLMQFIQNFLTAVGPQVTKSYASEKRGRMHFLLFFSTKFSFFLYVVMGLPLFLELDQVLSVWLVEVPNHTANFLRLLLLVHLSSSFFQPLNQACMATGKAGKFLVARGGTAILILLFVYVVFWLGFVPESMFVVQIIMLYIGIVIQLTIVAPLINLSKRQYLKKVVLRLTLTLISSVPIPLILWYIMEANLYRFITVSIMSVLSVFFSFYCIGLEIEEREMVMNFLCEKIPIIKRFIITFHH